MPVLFGSSYVLPALIVVVLVLILLLLLLVRKRGSTTVATGPQANNPPKASAKPTGKNQRNTRGRAAAAEPQTIPPARPSKRSSSFPDTAVSGIQQQTPHVQPAVDADPLTEIILDILRGWGDLTEDDTRRLSLYRPEKVLAAVETFQIPAQLKSSKFAPNRLAQLRRYASETLTLHEQTVAPEPVPSPPGYAEQFPEPPAPDSQGVAPNTETWRQATPDAPQSERTQGSERSPIDPWARPLRHTQGLPGSVRTAEELLALPEQERPHLVAFLEPAELAKVFEQTTDRELKKAIIDTLEHVNNPASLEVLRRCLDDPDPRIQLYALQAADRLLGVD